MTHIPQRHLDQLTLVASRHPEEGEYWLNTFSGDWVTRGFPFDREPRDEESLQPVSIEIPFPSGLSERVLALSKGTDVRTNMVLAAAGVALLARYTGSEDVCAGMPIYRQEGQKEFINPVLALRIQIRDDMNFKQLILDTRQTILAAVEHQNYPLEVLAHRLEWQSNNGRSPFFDTAFLLDSIHDRSYLDHICVPLIFVFSRRQTELHLILHYHPGYYLASTVSRIAGHFFALLQGALSNMDEPLQHLGIITQEERRYILDSFCRGADREINDITLHRWFEEQTAKTPANLAVSGTMGAGQPDRSAERVDWTYAQLNQRANALARVLREKGVGRDDIVAVQMNRQADLMTALLAVLKAGGAYMPVDPNTPGGRTSFILADSGSRWLVMDSGTTGPEEWTGETICLNELTDKLSENIAANSELSIDTAALAYVIYTSGTTGKPKGVLAGHCNVVAYMHAFFHQFQIDETDAVLQLASYCFDVFTEEVYPSLLRGGAVIIPDDREAVDFPALIKLINDYKVTIIDTTPMLLQEFNKLPKGNLGSIHTVISGGDVLKRDYVTGMLGAAEVYNTYGPTETTVCASYYRCGQDMPSSVPIGKPIVNTALFIIVPGNPGQMQPIGIAGELCISGAGVARGYLNRPELTAEKFIDHPPAAGDIMYRTGDLARWMEDGNIAFLGRIDSQVKIRGFRIETGEIENRLLAMDFVAEAAVTVRKDRDGQPLLCAYIVPLQDTAFSSSQCRSQLADDLPEYMIPAVFMPLDKIPLTSHGKVDTASLPEPEIRSDAPYVAPRNDIEKGLARIWRSVFGVERMGIDDDFFDLGGHSLTGIQIANEIHREFDTAVQFTEIFSHRTIRELAAFIAKQNKGKRYMSIEPVEKREYYPLSSAQKRLFVVQQIDPGSVAYNMAQGQPIEDTEPDIDFVNRNLYRLMERHESLRTSFITIDGKPMQRVHDTGDVSLEIEMLEPLEETLSPLEVREKVRRMFVRPFDLARPPLIRVGFIRIAGVGNVLLMDTHHIISDALSNDIIISDFLAVSAGQNPEPPRLQYRDFSHWQNRRREEGKISEQEKYWLEQFKEPVPELRIITDFERPDTAVHQGGRVRFTFAQEQEQRLIQMVLLQKTTTFTLFLALFNVLMFKLYGASDIVIGAPVTGRGHPDLHRTVGMFVNTLALRNYPQSAMTFEAFLQDVNQRTMRAFENQDYLFEDLVENVAARREVNRNPLFDIMFSFHEGGQESGAQPQAEENMSLGHESASVKFDITFDLVRKGDRFFAGFRYATELFKPETIENIIQYFQTLVLAIVENPGIRLGSIELTEKEALVELASSSLDDLEDE